MFPFIPALTARVWSPFSLHPVFSALCPSSPFSLRPPILSPPPLSFDSDVLGTYAFLSTTKRWSLSPLPCPSPSLLLTIFIICSYIVCLPVCLSVSFSVPHRSVWQPVVSNKKERIAKAKREQIRGRAAGRLVAALLLCAERKPVLSTLCSVMPILYVCNNNTFYL